MIMIEVSHSNKICKSLKVVIYSNDCLENIIRLSNAISISVLECFTNSIWSHVPLTSTCCVHSNVHGLANIHCIRYHTTVDSSHSTSPPVQKYHHPTSGSVELPWFNKTRNSSSIGEEPVSYGSSPVTSIIKSATTRLVSQAEESMSTFINVLQGHKTVVLVSCTIEWEPDTTCIWDISVTTSGAIDMWTFPYSTLCGKHHCPVEWCSQPWTFTTWLW